MKKYLVSNCSEREAQFLMYGSLLFGETNGLTYIFRLIGRYAKLKEEGNLTEIIKFSPETYDKFNYESKGIALIRDKVNQHEQKEIVSRRILFHLSRKWKGHPVIVSINVAEVMAVMLGYIREEAELKKAFKLLIGRTQNQITNMMPIQSEFLEVRSSNSEAKHSNIAADIIIQLNQVQYSIMMSFL